MKFHEFVSKEKEYIEKEFYNEVYDMFNTAFGTKTDIFDNFIRNEFNYVETVLNELRANFLYVLESELNKLFDVEEANKKIQNIKCKLKPLAPIHKINIKGISAYRGVMSITALGSLIALFLGLISGYNSTFLGLNFGLLPGGSFKLLLYVAVGCGIIAIGCLILFLRERNNSTAFKERLLKALSSRKTSVSKLILDDIKYFENIYKKEIQ